MEFKATKEERKVMGQIADRAFEEFDAFVRFRVERIDFLMDLEKAHSTTPLDLVQLLNFSLLDFSHDIFGILNHIDRNTGELQHCFLPRCAKPTRIDQPKLKLDIQEYEGHVTAMWAGPIPGVKGCPLGSAEDGNKEQAIRDLIYRTNMESKTTIKRDDCEPWGEK